MAYKFSFLQLARCLLLITGYLLTTGCSEAPDQPFRIGTNLWPGYEPLYLARNNQYFDKNIRLVEYPNATEVLRAFRNSSLEAACLTLDEVLLLRQYNLPVSVILVTDISDGGDVILAQQGINHVTQLAGKTIGIESGALGAYVISRALEKNNMSVKQIKIKHLGVDSHRSAFINKEIDAVATFDPVRTQLLSLGANEIFNSKQIPGEIVDVLVVNNNALATHEQRINMVIQGWFKALDDLKLNPEKSAEYISKRQKISADEVLASYQGIKLPSIAENRQLLGGTQPLLEENIQRLKRVMENEKLLTPGISVSKLLNDKFIPEGK